MIKKININNLGLFKSFNWDSIRDKGNSVIDLKKENIIFERLLHDCAGKQSKHYLYTHHRYFWTFG